MAEKVLKLINGVPRMVELTGLPAVLPPIYDETQVILMDQIKDPMNTVSVGLPGGQSYEGDELEVFLNGQRLEEGVNYTYPDPPGPFFSIIMEESIFEGDRFRFRITRDL
jgi:hypothetical protein